MSGKLHQDIHKSEYQQHIRAVRREDYNKRKQKQLIVVNGGRGRILRLLRFRCFRRLGILHCAPLSFMAARFCISFALAIALSRIRRSSFSVYAGIPISSRVPLSSAKGQ